MKNKKRPENLKPKTINRALKRPDWNTYFLELAHLASRRATCLRRKVGAVIVKNKHLLSTGYNGAPKGISHCDTMGCLREKLNVPSGERHELCRGLHAEQNAIIQAALYGVGLKEATLYCTTLPCSICAKMIINAGIKEIVISGGYPDKMASDFFKEAGIEVKRIKKRRKN